MTLGLDTWYFGFWSYHVSSNDDPRLTFMAMSNLFAKHFNMNTLEKLFSSITIEAKAIYIV